MDETFIRSKSKSPGKNFRVRHRKKIILVFILVCILIAIITIFNRIFGGSKPSPTSPSSVRLFKKAAVATEIYECSKLGKEILVDKGGSSVDAAIASILCNGIHNMHSSGIGGGAFMLIYDVPNGGTEKVFKAVDSREFAPRQYTQNIKQEPFDGKAARPLSIAVPTIVKGLYEAHKEFGKLKWAELVDPTVQLLKNGFKIPEAAHDKMLLKADKLKESDAFRNLLMTDDGNFVEKGQIITDPLLAKTFETIRDNPQDFFTGELAEKIIKELKDEGSIITLEDWKDNAPIWRDPISMKLNSSGYTLHNFPPPSSGIIYQFLMKLFEGFKDLSHDAFTYQRLAESLKFAFAKKSFLGDPDFVNNTDIMAKLRSEEYIKGIREKIDTYKTHDIPYYEPDIASLNVADKGTTHISVVAPNGGAVALTATINYFFGAFIRGKTTGIIYNNEMDDFNYQDDSTESYFPQNNLPEPHKRPISSMVPTIITNANGKVKYVIGASGGTRIISSTMFVSMQSIFMNTELEKAVDNKRLYHKLYPHVLTHDVGFSHHILQELTKLGHDIHVDTSTGVVQAIQDICDDGRENNGKLYCLKAVCDGRKHGIPDGL